MGDKKEEKSPIKEEILEEEGKKLSRDIARKHIYVKNKNKYPLPFEEYKIYHIDGKLFNDAPENLYLCTKEQRNALYEEQLRRKKPFTSSMEIDLFLDKIGKSSPEISKDKQIYEKNYNPKVPLYWKQKESRKKQLLNQEDHHTEIKSKIIDEIKEREEEIEIEEEENQFYYHQKEKTPKLKKQLIQEIRETEAIKKIKEGKRKMTLTEKIIIAIGILIVILLFYIYLKM